MNYFVCLLSVIASVQTSSINRLGWTPTTAPPPPPPPTTGWPAPAPTEPPTLGWTTTEEPPVPTTGWPAPAPEVSPGWPAPPPPPSGWAAPPSSISVELAAELAAAGSGAASEDHAEAVLVIGDASVPAELSYASAGEAGLFQDGGISQIASVDPDGAVAINLVTVSQVAVADSGVSLLAAGLDVANAQAANAQVIGEGAEAAAASTSILIS